MTSPGSAASPDAHDVVEPHPVEAARDHDRSGDAPDLARAARPVVGESPGPVPVWPSSCVLFVAERDLVADRLPQHLQQPLAVGLRPGSAVMPAGSATTSGARSASSRRRSGRASASKYGACTAMTPSSSLEQLLELRPRPPRPRRPRCVVDAGEPVADRQLRRRQNEQATHAALLRPEQLGRTTSGAMPRDGRLARAGAGSGPRPASQR